jgi:hypothetical protein
MVAVLQKFWSETTRFFPLSWARPSRDPEQEQHMVGEFRADYEDIPSEEWRAEVPEVEELLRESKVVSVKRGL